MAIIKLKRSQMSRFNISPTYTDTSGQAVPTTVDENVPAMWEVLDEDGNPNDEIAKVVPNPGGPGAGGKVMAVNITDSPLGFAKVTLSVDVKKGHGDVQMEAELDFEIIDDSDDTQADSLNPTAGEPEPRVE